LADDAVIKRIKEANDIVAVVGGYVALRPAGGTFKGLCPFHDDQHPSFDVDPRRQRYRCWSCNKYGDVVDFVQEHERVDFREALELLARRAGISLENPGASAQVRGRALMLELLHWSEQQYHQCLLNDALAQNARHYLGERQLKGETVRRYALGYAPLSGDWLVQRGQAAGVSFDLLEQVGLVARRQNGPGYYDRFRDRLLFPIRDALGRTVGFGGRILPGSPYEARGPKYYNSAETLLFKKSELLYGLDQAKQAAASAGYLAVVEGYTDVLMAHQMGVLPVVATMGTALNARHVQQLRRFVPRVVLVFDADAGGDQGADRALQVFAHQNVDLAVATLPDNMDPCDLLVNRGADAFRAALTSAVDALEFKLNQVLSQEGAGGVDGKRRAVDAVLGVLAKAPEMPGQEGSVKRQLMMTRISQRLGLREETVWLRLKELHEGARDDRAPPKVEAPVRRSARALPEEVELLEVLLAEPTLVGVAAAEVSPEEMKHPGLQRLLQEIYRMQAAGQTPDVDQIRLRLDNPELAQSALRMQDKGRLHADRKDWLQRLLQVFRDRRVVKEKRELQNQLHAANDPAHALELLRQLQNQERGVRGQEPGVSEGRLATGS
jgi:DNA primase